MPETAYPVLVYRVEYPGVFRTARMAFREVSDYMISARFMRSNSHYRVIRTDWLTEYEIGELGIHFAKPDDSTRSA